MAKKYCALCRNALLVVLFCLMGPWAWGDEAREVAGEVEFMSKAYGVRIHYAFSSQSFFPEVWRNKAGFVHGRQASLKQVKRALPIIQDFLEAYPTKVISNRLTDIYLLGRMEMVGHSIGGTYGPTWLYIVTSRSLSETTILATLHHEFSSLLMRNYPFPEEAWKKANPPDWEYAGGSRNMIEQIESQGRAHNPMGHGLFSRGFLTSYGQSCVEDDFNVYASWLFTRKDELDALAEQYPRIRKKRDLCKEFYLSISPEMD